MTRGFEYKVGFLKTISFMSSTIAAFFLILPGFISDTVGFFLLIPFTRKIIINFWLKKNYPKNTKDRNDRNDRNEIIDAEIIEEKKDKDEL